MDISDRPRSKPCKRYFAIDLLKALSALTVILIHVTSQYSSVPYINLIWIWSHFAVGVFVFASGFLLAKYIERINSFGKFWPWLKKRTVRIVRPYYVYVFVHVLLILLIPSVFDRTTLNWEPRFWVDTVLLHGGFGQNWIPRIFILLSLLFLLTQGARILIRLNSRVYLWTLLITLAFSIFFLFPPWKLEPTLSRYYQAVTWFAIMLLGMLFYRSRSKKSHAFSGAVGAIILTILGYIFLPQLGISNSIFKHKYPPTFYFVAYNTGVALFLYAAASRLEGMVRSSKIADRTIRYISNESYTIFFAHIIVMDALHKPTGFWLTDFLIISAVTVISVILWSRGVKQLRSFIRNFPSWKKNC
jgi:hypothetical protein